MSNYKIPFLPALDAEVPEGYEFSETVKDSLADAEMMTAHANHIGSKGDRVSRIVNDRRHKKTDTVKIDVPSNVPYMWDGTRELKSKTKLTEKEIKAARRAKRKYRTDYFVYGWGKSFFGKVNSRKHKQLREDRTDRQMNDE